MSLSNDFRRGGLFALGTFLGIAISVFIYLVGVRPSFLTGNEQLLIALSSAVVGAVLAGISSFAAVGQQIRQQKERDDLSDLKISKSKVFRFYNGFSEILSEYGSVKKHIDDAFSHPESSGMDPWARLLPALGRPIKEDYYDTLDLDLLFDGDHFSLINRLQSSHSKAVVFLKTFQKYCERREALNELMPIDSFDGNEATSNVDSENYKKLERFMVELNVLIGEMVSEMDDDYRRLTELVEPLGEAVREASGDPKFPILRPANGADWQT